MDFNVYAGAPCTPPQSQSNVSTAACQIEDP
jgi:hypothetical protein